MEPWPGSAPLLATSLALTGQDSRAAFLADRSTPTGSHSGRSPWQVFNSNPFFQRLGNTAQVFSLQDHRAAELFSPV